MALVTHEWRELGPCLSIGDVKLFEGGRYVVCGVEKTAVPNKWFEVHCPGQGFLMFEYDGGRWYGCRLRVGPQWQVTKGAFEGYLATLDLRDFKVSEVWKSWVDQSPYGTTPFFLIGFLLIGGGLFTLLIGEEGASFLILLGCLGVALGMGLARKLKGKYFRLTSENGVFDVEAAKFEKMLQGRLRDLEPQRTFEAVSQPQVQPRVELQKWQVTSIVSAR
jgi:hypothetical protein